MYGMSAFRLSNELKIPQEMLGASLALFQQYSGVKAYFESAVAQAKRQNEQRLSWGGLGRTSHRAVLILDNSRNDLLSILPFRGRPPIFLRLPCSSGPATQSGKCPL